MAFDREPARTPADIGTIRILVEKLPDEPEAPTPITATLDVTILDDTGEVLTSRTLDLWPHLTAGQRTAITNLVASMRTKAVAEIL